MTLEERAEQVSLKVVVWTYFKWTNVDNAQWIQCSSCLKNKFLRQNPAGMVLFQLLQSHHVQFSYTWWDWRSWSKSLAHKVYVPFLWAETVRLLHTSTSPGAKLPLHDPSVVLMHISNTSDGSWEGRCQERSTYLLRPKQFQQSPSNTNVVTCILTFFRTTGLALVG